MRNVMVLVLLLALCIPAMAQAENKTMMMPDMVGKWTGVMDAIVRDKNTAWMPNETVMYHGGEYTITIKEQNGSMFAGEMVPEMSPGSKEMVLGIFSSDNQSIAMVDENGYLWGYMLSPTELELSYQEVDMEGMEVASGILKKV